MLHFLKYSTTPAKRIIIVGTGVAGAEAGTYLGRQAKEPLDIIQIECEPSRRFGGWAFQRFPGTNTNLALRKMYLGRDPDEILKWISDPLQRLTWPEALQERHFSPDQPLPRELFQRYVMWRRSQVNNPLVNYHSVTGEAMHVELSGDKQISVTLRDGQYITGNQLIMASGSGSVKIPPYLQEIQTHERVIIDPLTQQGHEQRLLIPMNSRVLILGTGLTGEEQAELLYQRGHRQLTLFSRAGRRHFVYPEMQANLPLQLISPPDFLHANSLEELDREMGNFFAYHLGKGHSHEDILAAIRPHWELIRQQLGGCYAAANILHRFRRPLAVNSIGTSFEVAMRLKQAESEGALNINHGHIQAIIPCDDGSFIVRYKNEDTESDNFDEMTVDYIINAVGRTIIQHPIWQGMLRDGLAVHHAGIGVRVHETGQLMDSKGEPSDQIWVIGMARAGDHALRHGFLGNTAFNVPQVRAHVYDTVDAMLGKTLPYFHSKIDEMLHLISRDGLNARLSTSDETPLIWAVSEGHQNIALSLIQVGVDLNAKNNHGNTALIRAACEGRLELTKALISAGAKIDIQNDDGYTALILAKRRGHDPIVSMLLEAGADTTLKTRFGFSLENCGNVHRAPITTLTNPVLESRLIQIIRGTVDNNKTKLRR